MLKRNLIPVASIALLVIALVAVNVLAALVPLRLDVTQDRLFTLTDGSRRILKGLKDPVTIKLYVPDSVPDAPVQVKTFARRVRDLLQEYQSGSGGKLTLQVFDPKPDSEDEDWATRYGLSAAQLPDGSKLYLGMVVLSGGREAAIPFLDPRRERFLEYDISQAVARVNQPTRPKIGILPGLPIYGQPSGPMGQTEGEWAFVRELRKSYQVDYLFPQDLAEVPDGISVVMVLHPKGLSDSVLFALDQFLLRGGNLIVLTDPSSRMDPAGQQGMAPTSSNLEKLYNAWGVKFDPTMVVADQQLATRVNTPNQGIVEFPLWISLHPEQLNRDLVITSQLEEVTLIESGAFSLEDKSKYKLTPVMSSTANSGLMDLATVRFAGPLDISKQLKPDGKVRILAGLLTGTFNTAFPGGRPKPEPPPKPLGPQAKNTPKPKIEPQKPLSHPLLAKAARDGSVLLIGDADFIADRFSVQTTSFFGNAVSQPINDNLAFILNSVEFMAGSQDLIQIRSRGQVSRPFTRLANMQFQAARKFQEREQFLTQRLEDVKKKLESLQSQKQEGQKLVLSPAQMLEVKRFREEEAQVRGQLRDVRKVLRQDIEALGNVLLAINLLLVPVIVASYGFVVILRRGKRRGGAR